MTTIETLGNGVEAQPSTLCPCSRLGLFAKRPFTKRSRITEYDGELIDYSEMMRRLRNGHSSHIRGLDVMFIGIDGKHLKAEHSHRGGGSFANDARCTAHTNACFQRVTGAGVQRGGKLESLNRIVLVATRDIQVGEEIFVNYGKTYWKRHNQYLV